MVATPSLKCTSTLVGPARIDTKSLDASPDQQNKCGEVFAGIGGKYAEFVDNQGCIVVLRKHI